MLSGISGNYAGEFSWRERTGKDMRERYPEEISYIAHKTGFKNDLSVQENLRFYAVTRAAASGKKSSGHADDLDRKIKTALARLDVGGFSSRLFSTLSEGQRRRAVLARLLVETTVLWLLDEPTSALDHEGIALFEGLLAEHVNQGGVTVIATHRRLGQTDNVKRLQLSPAQGGQPKQSCPGQA